MSKELFVSLTPHETKVAVVEDDQLAEIYFERENEYTLAGSIYKGRVTRVLPGMQSAFVDIGLERDAFLYVSDFMELENQEDDLDEIPATPVIMESVPPESSGRAEATLSGSDGGSRDEAAETEQPEARADASTPEQREDRGAYRNRRRRRGRRDGRGSAPVAESRYSRPAEVQAVPEREQYGPPPGYQPIILPGESISKYRNAPHPAPVSQVGSRVFSSNADPAASSVASTFPNDEPIFAQPGHETEDAEGLPFPAEQLEYAGDVSHSSSPEAGTRESERSQERLRETKVAAVFGGEEAVEDTETEDPEDEDNEDNQRRQEERHPEQHSDFEPRTEESEAPPVVTAHGTMEEEEIDEEEADLASYVEELEEDAAFDEMEEETHAAGDYAEPGMREIAASGESGGGEVPFSAEPLSEVSVEVAQLEEEADEAEEEAEIEEAQAEAEALLDSE